MDWYKIVEKDPRGFIKTLFHGNNKTRKLPVNEWIEAQEKLVGDGTSKTKYLSGWHIIPTEEECIKYLKYFVNIENKIIVKCSAKNIRPKTHSRNKVFLAKYIKIEPVL